MNLRYPALIAVAGIAGVAALVRAHASPAAAPAPFAIESAAGEQRASSRSLRRPAPAGIVVYVAGEVRSRGLYTLAAGARAADALHAAGGPLGDADLVSVNLAQPLSDGDEVAVPAIDAAGRAPGTGARHHRTGHGRHRKHRRKHAHAEPSASGDSAAVDLNAAGADQLATLPGIGPELAARIVAYREIGGGFTSTDDLLDVAGVTPAKLAALEPYVRISGR